MRHAIRNIFEFERHDIDVCTEMELARKFSSRETTTWSSSMPASAKAKSLIWSISNSIAALIRRYRSR